MKKILIIGFIYPEPNSTAAGSRMMQLIELFQKEGYLITFASTATETANAFDLKKIDIVTSEIKLNCESFDQFIQNINPEIVLFDRYLTEEQFGWRVSENCPNALKILDTEDLHFLRYARQTAHLKNLEVTFELLKNEIAKRELASIYRCDLTLIISKYELKILKKVFNVDKTLLQYVPFLLDAIDVKKIQTYPLFKDRKHFITMGNFKHAPNWDSVQYLKSTIWPLIRKQLPKAEIHIYGAYASDKVQQLNDKKNGFLIKGWAENKEEIFKTAKICLAPLQFGAGLKGKLIDAMIYGTPSVTSTIGAEAMHGKLNWNGFICNNPEDFALKSVALYKNPQCWEEAQINGMEIINNCFSKEKYGQKLIEKVNFLTKNLKKHRMTNFIGLMLEHHTLRSTKYLSKWIEEKNKK